MTRSQALKLILRHGGAYGVAATKRRIRCCGVVVWLDGDFVPDVRRRLESIGELGAS